MAKRRSYGSGSVTRDGNGWRARISIKDPFTGKRKTRGHRAKTRAAAEKWLEQQNSQLVAGTDDTIKNYVLQYENDVLPDLNIADSTIKTRKRLIQNPILPTLGNVTFKDFPAASKTWLKTLNNAESLHKKPKPLSGATKLQAFQVLKQILDEAVREEKILTNPLDTLKAPEVDPPNISWLSQNDLELKFLPQIESDFSSNPRDCTIFLLIALTGLRRGEALGLRWQDIDIQNSSLIVRRSGPTTTKTKTKTNRRVPLPYPAAVCLEKLYALNYPSSEPEKTKTKKPSLKQELLKGQKVQAFLQGDADELPGDLTYFQASQDPHATDLVFVRENGQPVDVNNLRRAANRFLERAEITYKGGPFLMLRHGYATRMLLNKNVSIAEVSALLGHTNVRTTTHTYSHVVETLTSIDIDTALNLSERYNAGWETRF